MSGEHGTPTVVNGVLMRTSPSALERARRCLREWWFRYVMHLEDPPGAAAVLGIQVHDELAQYLASGDRSLLGPVALRALDWAPQPNAFGLSVEQELWHRVEGIPTLCKIDVLDRGMSHQDSEGRDVIEPDVVEVLDWKTKSNMRYTLSATKMSESIQMVLYGLVAGEGSPVRLSHVYLPTNSGRARKVSRVVSADWLSERRERDIVPLVRLIRETAGVSQERDVPADITQCRNCSYQAKCSAQAESWMPVVAASTDDLFGLFNRPTEDYMSVDNEIDKLLAEEAVSQPVGADPRLIEASAIIEASGHGFPVLVGQLAAQYCAMRGVPAMEKTQGKGKLGDLPPVAQLEGLVALATALAARAAKAGNPIVMPASPTPPPQPVPSVPAVAPSSLPPNPVQAAPLALMAPEAASVKMVADATPQPEEEIEGDAPAAPSADTSPPKRGRGRPPKAAGTPPVIPPTETTAQPTLYIKAVPSDVVPPSIDSYVAALLKAMADKFGTTDVRASDHAQLAFGKWKGVLAMLVSHTPLATDSVVYGMDEITAEVVGALVRSGKVRVVRGIG